MSEFGEFVDAALQFESSWSRAADNQSRFGGGLTYYGSSVGAIRGTMRNASLRFPGLGHDQITALCTELWAVPVFERRLAAIVLLQTNVHLLRNSDLTRIEGLLRTAGAQHLVDSLAADVIVPFIRALDAPGRRHAAVVLERWAADETMWLRIAAAAAAAS
jgi:hypothetical protein